MTTRYTEDHEYIATADGATGTVGITAYAQEQLGDIVFVDLPAVGKVVKKGEEAAVVESVKAASEIYAPVSGTITEVNEDLAAEPGLVNQDPAGRGWLFRIALSDPSELDALLDADGYAAHTR